jgi:hypothetical protein
MNGARISALNEGKRRSGPGRWSVGWRPAIDRRVNGQVGGRTDQLIRKKGKGLDRDAPSGKEDPDGSHRPAARSRHDAFGLALLVHGARRAVGRAHGTVICGSLPLAMLRAGLFRLATAGLQRERRHRCALEQQPGHDPRSHLPAQHCRYSRPSLDRRFTYHITTGATLSRLR